MSLLRLLCISLLRLTSLFCILYLSLVSHKTLARDVQRTQKTLSFESFIHLSFASCISLLHLVSLFCVTQDFGERCTEDAKENAFCVFCASLFCVLYLSFVHLSFPCYISLLYISLLRVISLFSVLYLSFPCYISLLYMSLLHLISLFCVLYFSFVHLSFASDSQLQKEWHRVFRLFPKSLSLSFSLSLSHAVIPAVCLSFFFSLSHAVIPAVCLSFFLSLSHFLTCLSLPNKTLKPSTPKLQPQTILSIFNFKVPYYGVSLYSIKH